MASMTYNESIHNRYEYLKHLHLLTLPVKVNLSVVELTVKFRITTNFMIVVLENGIVKREGNRGSYTYIWDSIEPNINMTKKLYEAEKEYVRELKRKRTISTNYSKTEPIIKKTISESEIIVPSPIRKPRKKKLQKVGLIRTCTRGIGNMFKGFWRWLY